MLPRIVTHVAGLAERRQVSQTVVAGVVVEMRAGQRHARPAERQGRRDAGEARLRVDHGGGAGQCPYPPAPAVPPAGAGVVPPSSVAEMHDVATVRPAAMLALPLGAVEADQRGQLAPVDRVEPAMFACDRHDPL